MDKGQKKLLVISLGISLAVLFAVLIFTIDAETLTALKSCMPAFLILSLAMHVVSLLFWALRIKLMCRSLGYKIRFFHCLNLVCSNTFIASITPSQIGGEPVRVYELTKAGMRGGDATAVVIMERVFDGIILAVGTILCVFALGVFFQDLALPDICMISAYTAAVVFSGLVLLFFVFARNPKWGYALMGRISNLLSRRDSMEKTQFSYGERLAIAMIPMCSADVKIRLRDLLSKAGLPVVWQYDFERLFRDSVKGIVITNDEFYRVAQRILERQRKEKEKEAKQ